MLLQTALTWLDLSFNQISKIQGLETLVNLTDLSLFDNQIAELEGLDTLTALHCLSLGARRMGSQHSSPAAQSKPVSPDLTTAP